MKCFLPLLFLIITSCSSDDKKFDRSTWNERNDMFYANRESMIQDLMGNYLKEGMNLQEVIDLIGQPENYANMKPNTIGYEIMVDYGWDIDPVEGKTLYIEFSQDSVITNFNLEYWEH